jgi:hypothetical protein
MDRRAFIAAAPGLALAGCVSVGGEPGPPAPAPVFRVGDRWVYRARDGFRVPVTWTETHEVTSVNAGGIDVRVTLVGPTMNYERTERLLSPGVVQVGAVFDNTETRNFEEPLIRYQFPLTPGSRWRQTLHNVNPTNQLRSTISRFVQVGGYVSVNTPAGTFNAIEMRILMSVDDNNPFRLPFQCNYVEAWAPEVGAMVRETKIATYRERGDGRDAIEIRAQNMLLELESYRRGG